jgi:hypothetical protein
MENKAKKEWMDNPEKYEDVVHEALGEFGRYQLFLNFLLSLISFSVSWQMLSMNFLAADSDFWYVE